MITSTPDINKIVTDIIKGNTVGVSDGSFKEGHGTSVCIIDNESGT